AAGRAGRRSVRGGAADRGRARAERSARPSFARDGAVLMGAAELVPVTVDDVGVQVPKGTGVVETALAAGIEIPVFCYEPRLGPPVGACRLCLCAVEGIPKLPTAR